jgi:hypothetical protein
MLRRRRQSPRTKADADHVKVKTEILQLWLMEKKCELVRRADVDALIDGIAGVTLTALSSLPARCAPRGDLATRRAIERVVFEVRTEIAAICQQMADKNGEVSGYEVRFREKSRLIMLRASSSQYGRRDDELETQLD